MKGPSTFFLTIFIIGCSACNLVSQVKSQTISYELTETAKSHLISEINSMSLLDKKYRNVIQLGTLDKELLKRDKELREKGNMKEYIAFTKTVDKTITEHQNDSLIQLQDKLDVQNHLKIRSIIQEYGYPSKDRLGVTIDKLAPILLHFPINTKPNKYLDEMETLLLPEVKQKRMEAKSFAGFYDNIVTRFLGKPQVYGTIKAFNIKTMTPGLPKIANIDQTNKSRRAIGLNELKEGEYEIQN